MHFLEKVKWINKIPKKYRDDFKSVLSRQNVHQVVDIGDEDYIVNIIDESKVVEKQDCKGELHVMCASNAFTVKPVNYKMVFGERNELVILKREGLNLTEDEDNAIDKYATLFCATIKKELDYHIQYRVQVIEETVEIEVKPVEIEVKKEQVEVVNEVKKEDVAPKKEEIVNETKAKSNEFSLEGVYEPIAKSGEKHINITAYYRACVIGVSIDSDNETLVNLHVAADENMEFFDKVRTISTAICMAQAMGSYFKYKSSDLSMKFYYYQDEVICDDIRVPEEFVDISEIAKAVKN